MTLTSNEREVLDKLAEVWNSFLTLEVLHPTERQEFMQAIHQAQYIVMARPASRLIGEEPYLMSSKGGGA